MAAVRPARVDPLHGVGPLNDFLAVGVARICGILLRTLFRLSRADVPALPEGPVILAPNHRSFLDPPVVGGVIDRRVFFMMHARYYDKPLLRWLYELVRCIPVEDGQDNRVALRAGQRVLESGRVLCVFPEGTISPDGRLGPAQPGVAWLARRTGAPVFPMYVGGTREALARGRPGLRFSRITARLGAPLYAADFPPGREGAEAFTAELMRVLAELGGER